MMSIDELRKKIDKIDESLIADFEKRMEYVKLIADYKIENKLPIINEKREHEVIDKAISRLSNKNLAEECREFLTSIMGISKEFQGKILGEENLRLLREQGGRIVYPGVEGSYSGQATHEFFGDGVVIEPALTFKDVCRQVADGSAKYGVLPIENSISGSVLEVIDRIEEFDCHIVGEHKVKIKHCLLGQKNAEMDDVKIVYSHPQGISQCKDYILDNDFNCKEEINTAVAAKMVKQSDDISKAAIASEMAAKLYGLRILDYNIQKNASNYTRFVIIAKEYDKNPQNDKISISFVVSNQPGSLYHVLSLFDKLKLNICRLESRPVSDKPWDYKFYLDFNASSFDERINVVFGQLQLGCGSFRVIGMYKGYEEIKI
jgi:chorismate mutase / prephenate dehydratase